MSVSSAVNIRNSTTGRYGQSTREFNDVKVNGVLTAPLRHQPVPAAGIGTGAQTLTIAEVLTEILEEDPEGSATWTLPTAALAVAGVANVGIGDSLDFYVINNATSGSDEIITLAAGSGGSIVGNTQVPCSNVTAAQENSGSAKFRMRFTAVDSGNEAYVCYRLA